MTNLIAETFKTLSRKQLEKEIMDYQSREKYWQTLAGRMARIAHWALMIILAIPLSQKKHDMANSYMREVTEVMPMDEEDS